jgi:hypothetical protein
MTGDPNLLYLAAAAAAGAIVACGAVVIVAFLS